MNARKIATSERRRRAAVEGGGRASIVLTEIARIHAEKSELRDDISELWLGAEVALGDVVTLEKGSGSHDFAITARRWRAGDGAARLELTLDYPVRRGR